MKKLIIFLLILLPWNAHSQIKDILKKVNIPITKQDVLNAGKNLTIKYLEESRNNYDPTDFNYAVSFSDNSGLFESEEKYRRYEKGLLYALSPESMQSRTPEQKSEDYNDVGEVLYASNKFKAAEASFMAAYLINSTEGLESTKRGALVISNLGLLFHTTGRLSKAEEFTQKALVIRRDQLNDLDGVGASLNNLAVLYKDLGRYTESEDLFDESIKLTLQTKGPTSTAYAVVENNKAILYQVVGKYQDAEKLLLSAIEIAGKELKEKSANYVRMKVNLAMLYQLQKRYAEAEKIYLEAIDLKKKRLGTTHPDYAVLLKNLASLYMAEGKYDKVESLLTEAIEIYRKKFGEAHHVYAAAIYDLGSFKLFRDDLKGAAPLLAKAESIQKSQLGEHHPSLTDSREALAVMEWMSKDWDKAIPDYLRVMNEYIYQVKTYFPAMSEYDKSRFWELIYPKFQRFFTFALEARTQHPEITSDLYNYHLATKALLLNSTSKVKDRILNSGNPELVSKYREWLDLKENLARLYTLSKEELAENKINLDSLENVTNTREKELSRLSEAFTQGYEAKTIGYKDVSAILAPQEACVDIVRIREYNYLVPDTSVNYLALLLKPGGTASPQVIMFPNGTALETSYARKYRMAMQRAFEGQNFRDIFWKGMDEPTASYKRLFVSLDGIYNQINLNTLSGSSGKYLLDEKDIILVTNTKDVISLKKKGFVRKPEVRNAVLVGNPNYAKDFVWNKMKTMTLPELPGTEVEVKKINDQLVSKGWKTKLYLKDDASEDKIRMVDQPVVLHIATHGFFLEDLKRNKEEKVFGVEPMKAAENPLLRSGLLFTGADNTLQEIKTTGTQRTNDGVLNAYEAMIMNLDHTELVVLSACETGLGEIINGEGVYGLQRALQIAGATTVMISLWQVSDEVTQDLMIRFYKYWIETGNKQTSFTRAQLEIKQKYPAPFYWGAFVMVNN
jgi:CHAT domain-containing protein/tetratricopeptide (TPR) repeat protein